jgi:hypothetical protein
MKTDVEQYAVGKHSCVSPSGFERMRNDWLRDGFLLYRGTCLRPSIFEGAYKPLGRHGIPKIIN